MIQAAVFSVAIVAATAITILFILRFPSQNEWSSDHLGLWNNSLLVFNKLFESFVAFVQLAIDRCVLIYGCPDLRILLGFLGTHGLRDYHFWSRRIIGNVICFACRIGIDGHGLNVKVYHFNLLLIFFLFLEKYFHLVKFLSD